MYKICEYLGYVRTHVKVTCAATIRLYKLWGWGIFSFYCEYELIIDINKFIHNFWLVGLDVVVSNTLASTHHTCKQHPHTFDYGKHNSFIHLQQLIKGTYAKYNTLKKQLQHILVIFGALFMFLKNIAASNIHNIWQLEDLSKTNFQVINMIISIIHYGF